MPELSLDGRTLHFLDAGDGPAVLLLHAFPLSAAMWEAQASALAPDFRVVVPDLPGFGTSPAAPGASMESFAQDALALLDHLGVPAAAVVGLSMGGYVALELRSRARERVAALALCDTRAEADSPEARKGREATALAVEAEGPGVLVERLLPNLLSRAAPPALRERVERMIRACPPAGAAAALRAMAGRRDFTLALPRIACPTLVLVGEDDALTPPALSEAMSTVVPGARLARLPGAGHLSNLEQPEAFDAALRAFLDDAVLGA